MVRTFNCGIGMVVVVAPDAEARVTQVLKDHGETVHRIGGIVQRAVGAEGCIVRNTERW
jgi:phosphoribosylaminoimidazole (AIR) synthetase